MSSGEYSPRAGVAFSLKMVNAECSVCRNRYTFAASRARAQLACPKCQEIARERFELKRSSRWKAIVVEWLDKWLLELVLFSVLADVARHVN